MKKIRFIYLIILAFIFISCTSKEDKKICETVDKVLVAASEENFEEVVKYAPFMSDCGELGQLLLMKLYSEFNEKKDKITVVKKDTNGDAQVKITFVSDFDPIIMIVQKDDNNQYILTEDVIESQEYDYIEASD